MFCSGYDRRDDRRDDRDYDRCAIYPRSMTAFPLWVYCAHPRMRAVATTATVAGTGTGTESVTTIAATTVAALARARAKATQYQVVHRRLAIVSRSAGVATNSTKCKKTTVMSWAVAQRAGSLCAVSVINMCSDRKAASPDGLAANRGLPDTAQHSSAQRNATQQTQHPAASSLHCQETVVRP